MKRPGLLPVFNVGIMVAGYSHCGAGDNGGYKQALLDETVKRIDWFECWGHNNGLGYGLSVP